MSAQAKPKQLILFSGGKDSFLTACRAAADGHPVTLLSFNGGSVIGEENLRHGADRLIRMYGSDMVEYAGVYSTAATIACMNSNWIYYPQRVLGAKYPELTNCQLNCLHCQTAMWVAALAYAKAKGISEIACGYKKSDVFCTGSNTYFTEICALAEKFQVNITRPLWEMGDDFERDTEMIMRGFEAQVLEPKCLLGRPCSCLSYAEHSDMFKYFTAELKDMLPGLVEHLIPIFKYIRLSDTSFDKVSYPST